MRESRKLLEKMKMCAKYDGRGEAVKDADWLHRGGEVESSFSLPSCLFLMEILDSGVENI